uniref:Eukaryotic translation initiation factor 3 subunit L n=1 Tax=Rousettus aegyptiacus TaxID=9407 RepID=A0A7J8JCR8_ROUAE|nr:eukaryotic translation initiation factor 3 subunit L [Rousettus aegyptiacus]
MQRPGPREGLSRDSHAPYYGRIPNATHSPGAQDSLQGLTPQRASSVGSDLNVQSREAPFLNALSLHGTKFQLSLLHGLISEFM